MCTFAFPIQTSIKHTAALLTSLLVWLLLHLGRAVPNSVASLVTVVAFNGGAVGLSMSTLTARVTLHPWHYELDLWSPVSKNKKQSYVWSYAYVQKTFSKYYSIDRLQSTDFRI